MFRITVEEKQGVASVLKIEGRLVDLWTAELSSTWRTISTNINHLCLDISGLTSIDQKGKTLLREIVHSSNCTIRADTPRTQDFAMEITRNESDLERNSSI